MSKMRYYKCRVPRTKRYASNGQPITFKDVGNDIGIGATDNDWLANEIDAMIVEQRGGVWKIEQAEYEELKKNPTSTRPWREEVGKLGPEVNHKPVLPAMRSLPPPENGAAVPDDGQRAEGGEQRSEGAAAEVAPERPKAVKRKAA